MRTVTIFASLAVAVGSALAVPYSNVHYVAEPNEEGEPVGSGQFWWKIIISVVLVLSGGVFAGCVSFASFGSMDAL